MIWDAALVGACVTALVFLLLLNWQHRLAARAWQEASRVKDEIIATQLRTLHYVQGVDPDGEYTLDVLLTLAFIPLNCPCQACSLVRSHRTQFRLNLLWQRRTAEARGKHHD